LKRDSLGAKRKRGQKDIKRQVSQSACILLLI
jgi:hypothetical protein